MHPRLPFMWMLGLKLGSWAFSKLLLLPSPAEPSPNLALKLFSRPPYKHQCRRVKNRMVCFGNRFVKFLSENTDSLTRHQQNPKVSYMTSSLIQSHEVISRYSDKDFPFSRLLKDEASLSNPAANLTSCWRCVFLKLYFFSLELFPRIISEL